jgi:hypothetical protein
MYLLHSFTVYAGMATRPPADSFTAQILLQSSVKLVCRLSPVVREWLGDVATTVGYLVCAHHGGLGDNTQVVICAAPGKKGGSARLRLYRSISAAGALPREV